MPQHGIVITGGNTAEDYYNPQFDRLPYLGHASIQRFTRRQKRAAKRARLRHEDAWMLFDMEIEDGSGETCRAPTIFWWNYTDFWQLMTVTGY